MYRFLPYIFIAVLVYMVLFYFETYQADLLENMIIKADIMGITRASKREHERVDKIKRLENIGSLEKQVLIDHTVFIGATAEMMEYAIGAPKHILRNPADTAMLYYVYFLAGDKRPTFFEMNCAGETPEKCKYACAESSNECTLPLENRAFFVLAKAYKRSAIDVSSNSNSLPGR